MPNIDPLRKALNDARSQAAKTRKEIFLGKEQLKKITDKEARLSRHFNPQNKANVAEQNRLTQERQRLEKEIKGRQGILGRQVTAELGAWTNFQPLADPRENLGSLDDHYPILMLPLRIETRFKRVETPLAVVSQMWVRVFPDDCAIDTYEETLSNSEIRNAQDFWAGWWAAAGQDTGRRGAWRGLVAGHGAGRAQHIFNTYKPTNAAEEPKIDETIPEPQVFLIIATEEIFPANEKTAMEIFWETVWRAKDDTALLNNAQSAFEGDVGVERAAFLVENYSPNNINDLFPEIDRDEAEVKVLFVQFPGDEETESQSATWTQAPKVQVMPERLVLLGYENEQLTVNEIGQPIPFPLVVGVDPRAEPEDQMKLVDGDIQVSEDMKWMVDFDEAVAKGMGFRINLTSSQVRTGFDKLMVLGVRMSADQIEGKDLFGELIDHHYHGNSGFSFLPVGTPTNNTLESGSGHTNSEDADESYELLFNTEEEAPDPEIVSWWTKSDRTWFTEVLGLSPDLFDKTINTDGKDQCEARAMNVALWPATWGYFFETMMKPVFEENDIEMVRWFFNRYVVGRGTIPSIRIDEQPYGILPTTVFSRMKWVSDRQFIFSTDREIPKNAIGFLPRLYSLFTKIQEDWKGMKEKVAFVGKSGDPHQLLLDILGLHGGSVEFYQRYSQSLNHIFNLYNMANQQGGNQTLSKAQQESTGFRLLPTGPTVTLEQVWKAALSGSMGRSLMTELGYTEDDWPDILEKLFVLTPNKLMGDLIDDQELSEVNPIRVYAEKYGEQNYIQWLVDAASDSFDVLRKGEGFIDNKRPNALLYLMLKHAMELEFYEAGLKLYRVNELLSSDQLRMAKIEPDFVHIRDAQASPTDVQDGLLSKKPLDFPFASESKYNLLYQKQPAITNDNDLAVANYIPKVIKTHFATQYLWEQVKALRHLEATPTARLERIFTEHIDCASYRFDAWKSGLLHFQLEMMRHQNQNASTGNNNGPGQGLFIGAYGWLENVRSENKVLNPITLDPDLEDVFDNPSDNPIVTDSTNAGFIHAPSLTHAVTGAVLRNGYLSNANEGNPDLFAINLSSERVRLAMGMLEGIRNGQSLAALLGYRFERYIHDRNQNANVDQYIYKIRRKFPLVGNQFSTTKVEDDTSIEAIEARNVVDGIDLIKFVEARLGPNGEPNYFNDLGLGSIPAGDKTILADAIDHIRDVNDAVGDLGLAESVHQVVQGNIDRAAGTLDTYSTGNYPQPPDVVQTPRSGVNITHRIGLQIDPNADPTVANYTPRAKGEPGLNKLLEDLLPDLSTIFCLVSFSHASTSTSIPDYEVTMEDLGLQPIDLLYILDVETDQAMSSLDDLIVHYIRTTYPTGQPADPPSPDAEISIAYFKQVAGKVSLFELIPMIRHLRTLLLKGRALQAGDVMLNAEATQGKDQQVSLDKQRMDLVMNYLTPVQPILDTYVNTLQTAIDNDDENTLIGDLDTRLDGLVDILVTLNATGMQQTGFGFGYEWRGGQMNAIFEKVDELIQRWTGSISDFDALMVEYTNLPGGATTAEKFELLSRAERLVSSTYTEDPGADPDAFRTTVLVPQRDSFDSKKDDLQNFRDANHQQFSATLASAEALLVYDTFDPVATDWTEIRSGAIIFIEDLHTRSKKLKEDLDKRITDAGDLLASHGSELNPANQVQILQEAAKLLLSEDFKMIPSFSLPPEVQDEWQKVMDHQTELLSYQTTTLNNPMPVDDWFYGVSRVREKMGHLEQMFHMAEGFQDLDLELIPAQFPYKEPYSWFGVEFGHPDEETAKELDKIFRETDHLLYTAYYHQPYVAGQPQCGILLDEWTEVVPTEEETSGIAFHYDRPNSEPPQVMLLVTPPQFQGAWQWQDLVDALHETLEEAKLRAVEPEQIDKTGYSSFLPATISMVTRHPISIMMNYAFNNGLASQLQAS